MPVLLGSAENGNGILRLLEGAAPRGAVRRQHGQAPEARERQVGRPRDEDDLHAARRQAQRRARADRRVRRRHRRAGRRGRRSAPPAAFSLLGQEAKKRGPAKAGDTVALGRLEKIYSGETLSAEKGGSMQIKAPEPPEPVYGVAIGVKDRKDEVKLTGALAQADGGGPLAQARARQGHAPDGAVGPGRDAPARRARAAQAQVRRGGRVASRGRCPTRRRSARASRCAAGTRSSRAGTASSATWCSTSSRCRAASASSSTTRSPAAWCRKQFIPSVEIGVSDYLQHGTARRLPGGRRGGDADRRLLPLGRLLRHGVPPGRPHRHERGHAQVQPRAARADHGGRDRHPVRGDRAHQRHDPAAARADPGLRRARGLARLGRGAGAASRSPRWTT